MPGDYLATARREAEGTIRDSFFSLSNIANEGTRRDERVGVIDASRLENLSLINFESDRNSMAPGFEKRAAASLSLETIVRFESNGEKRKKTKKKKKRDERKNERKSGKNKRREMARFGIGGADCKARKSDY